MGREDVELRTGSTGSKRPYVVGALVGGGAVALLLVGVLVGSNLGGLGSEEAGTQTDDGPCDPSEAGCAAREAATEHDVRPENEATNLSLTGEVRLSRGDDMLPRYGRDCGNRPGCRQAESGRGHACFGIANFDDISPGMEIVVSDGTGRTVAVGRLEEGYTTGDDYETPCVLPFAVEDLTIADFYRVELGTRGAFRYSYEELEAQDWQVDYDL